MIKAASKEVEDFIPSIKSKDIFLVAVDDADYLH